MQVAPEAQAAPERPEQQVSTPFARGVQYDLIPPLLAP